ncbi:TlpA family protein disulfide reductase [candidate division WOR-3 bacterium]|nr:TlpA family protein disulfide reductase [candidate division WOR-3 bacterium]
MMKLQISRLCALLLMAVLLSVSCGKKEKEPKGTNQKNPLDFTLKDLEGNEYTLSGQKGKVVIIDFWATWCRPCLQSIPIFISLYDKYKDRGLLVLGVGLDKEESLRKFAKRYNISYPILVGNQEVARKYGVQAIPTTCIIDKSGNLAKKHIGLVPGMQKVLEEEIKSLLEK